MSAQAPDPQDPLAALAKAAARAVQAEDASRDQELAAKEADARAGRRWRAVAIAMLLVVLAGILAVQGPRMVDPYYGEDPLAHPQRARAYVARLLDDLSAYRARKGGTLPNTLEIAIPEDRLPPRGSPYRLEYRVEDNAPVLTLQGGREPVTLRGAAR